MLKEFFPQLKPTISETRRFIPSSLIKGELFLIPTIFFDMLTTIIGQFHGIKEMNPLGFTLVYILNGLSIVFWLWLIKKDRPNIFNYYLYLASFWRFCIGLCNIYIILMVV